MTAVEEELPAPTRRRVVVAPPRSVGSRRVKPLRPSGRETPPPPRLERQAASTVAARQRDAVVSPTVDIQHVMQVFLIGLALALVFGVRGLVHSGKGMDLGPERTVVLALSQPLQAVTSAVGLTLPWDTAERALGRTVDTGNSPLLTANTNSGPTKPHRPRVVLPPLRVPTQAHPLRLLVTGDSLTEYLAPQLVDEASRAGPVRGYADTHYGTGIVRPDFVDWSVVARQQVSADHPDAVVVFMGGNDNQNIQLQSGEILQAGSPKWTEEYARRVAVCMRIWSQGGRARVYWLSMPPARSDSWSAVNRQINLAIRRAARQVPRTRYLDVLGPVTAGGKYADFVSVNGQATLVRTPDGIHFNSTGSDIVSHEILSALRADWHLGSRRGVTGGARQHRSTRG